ncbi:hypothetical protein [Dasineura jujubifolia toursvirus 2a]|nr:hypothetical protein [Dasineura jujubifolia toursvirus 2a]
METKIALMIALIIFVCYYLIIKFKVVNENYNENDNNYENDDNYNNDEKNKGDDKDLDNINTNSNIIDDSPIEQMDMNSQNMSDLDLDLITFFDDKDEENKAISDTELQQYSELQKDLKELKSSTEYKDDSVVISTNTINTTNITNTINTINS